MRHKPVYRFVLEVLLWLPLAFGGWYFFSLMLSTPVGVLLEFVLTGLWPEWVESVQQNGYLLEIVTTIKPALPAHVRLLPGQEAIFSFDVNPLIYGYGLPFLVALVLASPGRIEKQVWQLSLSWLFVLLPIQVFGLAGLALKTLVFNTSPEVMNAIASAAWQREAIGLAYQFGSLILPAVTPLVVWVFLYRDYLQELAPQFSVRDNS